jgi:uncharacterized protein YecE (DUF72 family)
VRAAAVRPEHQSLASRLPPRLWLGTSSWTYPAWTGLVWEEECSEAMLSRHGLRAFSQHPLLNTVSVDRALYRALTHAQYAAYAAQVPDAFRFMVKAPATVCDALVRDEQGRARQPNPTFLDARIAEHEFLRPATEGLRTKTGALVFQLSPLPAYWLRQPQRLIQQLGDLLAALPRTFADAPDAVIAVEVRDPVLLIPAFADMLKANGATYCLGLHAKMPPIEAQLPLLRRLWPGPLVCRWSLHRRHGAFGYEQARQLYAPFQHIQDPDPETRATLAKVIAATTGAGLPAYVSVSNKAEGCAPLSVEALARAVLRELCHGTPSGADA